MRTDIIGYQNGYLFILYSPVRLTNLTYDIRYNQSAHVFSLILPPLIVSSIIRKYVLFSGWFISVHFIIVDNFKTT